jgi:hypothetical protein
MTCRCGHDRGAHEHYRGGSDCGTCGPLDCPRYRASWWRDLVAVVVGSRLLVGALIYHGRRHR